MFFRNRLSYIHILLGVPLLQHDSIHPKIQCQQEGQAIYPLQSPEKREDLRL
jgi:hypothetical protein